MKKMTLDEIRKKFDEKVDYYSNAEAGQENTPDAAAVLDMIMASIKDLDSAPESICDLGCGAGNFSLRLSRQHPGVFVDLVDLSSAMLERAVSRVSDAGGIVQTVTQGDINSIQLPENRYDIIVSGACLHHLREEEDWERVIGGIFRALKPGGSFWYWDLVDHEHPSVRKIQYQRWGKHLSEYKDDTYRDYIFVECEKEDSPRSIPFITSKMMKSGFYSWDVLHKNAVFSALVAFKKA